MKIKNEYIKIEVGNKTYIKKNMILNKYLNKIFQSQINPSFTLNSNITKCYLKLDTPLENISYDSELSGDVFEVNIGMATGTIERDNQIYERNSTKNNDSIIVSYRFASDGDFQYKEYGFWHNGTQNDFNVFNGRKITNIGFGNSGVYAVVDVSDLNIILNGNEKLIISRVDLYQSDAICEGFNYPLHLVNFTAKYNANFDSYTGKETCEVAQLYSIGLGNIPGIMVNEHIIDYESEDVIIGDNNITINFNEFIKKSIYPSENLFPSNSLFMKEDNTKYLILKYRMLRIESVHDEKTYLDEYYTMNYKYDLSEYDNHYKSISFNLEIERL